VKESSMKRESKWKDLSARRDWKNTDSNKRESKLSGKPNS
jgi:hypothetical protein